MVERGTVKAGPPPGKSGFRLLKTHSMFSHRYLFRTQLIALFVIGSLVAPAMSFAAEAAEHETLSLKATPLFQIGKFSVTNSMLVCWIVALAVIMFAQIATRNVKTVASGALNIWEGLVAR